MSIRRTNVNDVIRGANMRRAAHQTAIERLESAIRELRVLNDKAGPWSDEEKLRLRDLARMVEAN